jgi:hypothetical protein
MHYKVNSTYNTTQNKTNTKQQTILTIYDRCSIVKLKTWAVYLMNFYYENLIAINVLSWLSETNALLEEAYDIHFHLEVI